LAGGLIKGDTVKLHEVLKAMVEDGAKIRHKTWALGEYRKLEGDSIVDEDGHCARIGFGNPLDDGWEIIPETMGFMEATKQIWHRGGCRIRRITWGACSHKLLFKGARLMWERSGTEYVVYGDDIFATDWVVELPE
jgi:hypothetical protein